MKTVKNNQQTANPIKDVIIFYEKAEKLKTTMRHSWLSDKNRQESSAEHSWMLGLLAMMLFSEIQTNVDKLKVLKLVLVHDLAEAVTGDIPSFEISSRQSTKHETEAKALTYLVSTLPKQPGDEIIALWEEFEACETPEAKFANSLDKIEVLLQHNVADISTWGDGDYRIGPYYKDHFFDFDDFMRSFKDYVDIETMKKVLKAKQGKRILPEHLERYHKETKGKKQNE